MVSATSREMGGESRAVSAAQSSIGGLNASLGGSSRAPLHQDAQRRGANSASIPRQTRHRRNVSVGLPIIVEGDETRCDGASDAPGLPAVFGRRSRSAASDVPEHVAFNLLTTGPFGDAVASGAAPSAFDSLDRANSDPSDLGPVRSDSSSDTDFSLSSSGCSSCRLGSSGQSSRSSLSTEEIVERIMGGASPFESACPAVVSMLAGLSYRDDHRAQETDGILHSLNGCL